jgi:hypothetical protein
MERQQHIENLISRAFIFRYEYSGLTEIDSCYTAFKPRNIIRWKPDTWNTRPKIIIS